MIDDTPDRDLVCAFAVDGGGTSRALDWQGIETGRTSDTESYRWVHLHHAPGAEHEWLTQRSNLDPLVISALLASETRPRCTPFRSGAILNLRGVNLNPGADPEDMISLRLWVEPERIVTVRLRRLMAVQDMRETIAAGHAPESVGAFLALLAFKLTDRMEPEIQDVSDRVDDLEDDFAAMEARESRARLAALRREAVILRRFIAPQRDALIRLTAGDFPFIDESARIQLREAADRVTRMVEELDAVRERTAVIHDQLTNRRAEDMNRHMLVLSIGAAVFLPLTFITGLLGMNVGGLPWSQSSAGFTIVVILCVSLGAGMMWVFRRIGWI